MYSKFVGFRSQSSTSLKYILVKGCGPQGPLREYKGACCFFITKAASELLFDMTIGLDRLHTLKNIQASLVKKCGPEGP